MKQRRLGSSDVSASVIGLGGVEFGPEDDAEPDIQQVVRVIESRSKSRASRPLEP